MKKRLVVGVSGASGAPLAVEALKMLREAEIETHLIITRGGEITLQQEAGMSGGQLAELADVLYDAQDIGAAIASGSFAAMGMLVVPCSMKTVAGIASGYSDNLLLRAADVTIKERRPLVLAARESPLSTLHLRNLLELSRMGVTIVPPMLSYYYKPASLEEATRHAVGKMLDLFGIEAAGLHRWEGTTP